MKTARNSALFALLFSTLLLEGCQLPTKSPAVFATDGGIGVGNGATYRSPHGFQVEYRKELDLVVESAEAFRVENATLAKTAANTSKISFTVLKETVKDLAELRAFLGKEHPELTFKETTFPGATGLYHEKRQQERLDGLYYILTANQELVFVEISAFAFANGLEWVAPIVKTFTYDIKPPVIHEFRVDGEWVAGRKNRFYFRATDDYSGISNFMSGCGGFTIGGRSYVAGLPLCGMVLALGDDWYAVDVDVSPYVQDGEYTLRHFTLEDKAGNLTTLDLFNGTYNGQSAVKLPQFKFQIRNTGSADVTPPTIHEFRVDGEWIAGRKNRLYFRATDDYSGISNFMSSCGGFTIGGGSYVAGLPLCGMVLALGDDWYAVDVDVSPYVQAGEYTLRHFTLEDKARNHTTLDLFNGTYNGQSAVKLPQFKLQIRNTGSADVTPPTIHEFRVDGEWIAGRKNRLYFRATDDYSGISNFMSSCGGFTIGGGSYVAGLPLCGMVLALGDDWYAVDVDVSPYVQAGEYTLNHFTLEDKARNHTTLDLFNGTYNGQTAVRLPAFKLTIIK